MDLSDYFEPVDFAALIKGKYLPGKLTLGNYIIENNQAILHSGLKNINAAIVGVPVHNGRHQKNGSSSPDFIRKELYSLASFESNLKIIDFGNLKSTKSLRGTLMALRDIVEYLRKLNVTVIILGGSQDLTSGICKAFESEKFFWLSAIDSVYDGYSNRKTNKSDNFLSTIFRQQPEIFQFSLIGYQQQLTGEQFTKKNKESGSHLRLGELRADIKQAEVLLRNSHVVSFDLSALKHHDAPATSKRNPNGLYGEEACQLAQYAGLSQKPEVFGLFELRPLKRDFITPAIAAEIIWYFLKGVSNRSVNNNEIVYKVEIEGMDAPIVFRYDREFDRWWFDVQALTGEIIKIACSEKDYQQAAANEIPERWLNFIQKMDSMSK